MNSYSKSLVRSFNSSKKYSATGGTGGGLAMSTRTKYTPTKVLGDYQLAMVNKAFADF